MQNQQKFGENSDTIRVGWAGLSSGPGLCLQVVPGAWASLIETMSNVTFMAGAKEEEKPVFSHKNALIIGKLLYHKCYSMQHEFFN